MLSMAWFQVNPTMQEIPQKTCVEPCRAKQEKCEGHHSQSLDDDWGKRT